MGSLARLARSTPAVVAFAAAGMVSAAWAPADWHTVDAPPGVAVAASRLAGMPGEQVGVEIALKTGAPVDRCEVNFQGFDAVPCTGNTATVVVPETTAPATVRWRLWTPDRPNYQAVPAPTEPTL